MVLSHYAHRYFVESAFQAGAVGYVLKGGVFEELVQALRMVPTGQVYLGPSVADLGKWSLKEKRSVERLLERFTLAVPMILPGPE